MNILYILHVGKYYRSGLNQGKYSMMYHNPSPGIQNYGLLAEKLTHYFCLWQIPVAWLCVPIALEAGFGLWLVSKIYNISKKMELKMKFWTGICCTSYQQQLFAKATKPVHYRCFLFSAEKPGNLKNFLCLYTKSAKRMHLANWQACLEFKKKVRSLHSKIPLIAKAMLL